MNANTQSTHTKHTFSLIQRKMVVAAAAALCPLFSRSLCVVTNETHTQERKNIEKQKVEHEKVVDRANLLIRHS